MMKAPLNLVEVLTAAAPIVASITNKNKDSKGNNTPTINVTIHNNFYIKSDQEMIDAIGKIKDQVTENIGLNDTRYII